MGAMVRSDMQRGHVWIHEVSELWLLPNIIRKRSGDINRELPNTAAQSYVDLRYKEAQSLHRVSTQRTNTLPSVALERHSAGSDCLGTWRLVAIYAGSAAAGQRMLSRRYQHR